jgi:hypothetical protein
MTILFRITGVVCALLCGAFCQGAELLVRTDVECRLRVDGAAWRTLKTGDGIRLTLPAGGHQLEALPLVGAGHWRKEIRIAAADERKAIDIELRDSGYWIDPDTQLMWTAADNGLGLSRSQAVRFCRQLTLGGFRDWTLPSIDELQRIFGGPESQVGYHITGPIKLTGWQWSSTSGKQDGEGWALDFGDGGRASVADGDSGLNRALCIRHASNN